MSPRNVFATMPRGTRHVWAGIITLILAVGGALGVREVLADRASQRDQPHPVTDAMDGMAMAHDGSVRLTADQIRSFGVTFGVVERRTITNEIRAVGMVNIDETRLAGVTTKVGGYVERLYVDFIGRLVRAGEPLMEIYSPELVAAQEELLLAARLQGALEGSSVPGVPAGTSDLVGAARRRLRLWDISDAQIDRILAEGQSQRTLTLYAPVGGVVIQKNVVAGEAVAAGQPLYRIADLREVWVEAELREVDAALIRQGDAVSVELTALPGRPIEGHVEYVYPTLQSETRSLRARVAIPNPDGRLMPGMYATVRIIAPVRDGLTVPLSAVLNTGDRRLVFVDLGQGRIAPQEVELGRSGTEYVEVIAGLEPGQRVVTSAQYLLDSESNLAETMRSVMGVMNMPGMGSMEMEGMDPGADMRGVDRPARER